MTTVLFMILILWAIVGVIILVLLHDDGAYPSDSSRKNIITIAICGPIIWVVGPIIAGYSALKEWLE